MRPIEEELEQELADRDDAIADLRARVAIATRRYEQECAGAHSRIEEIVHLRAENADLLARLAEATAENLRLGAHLEDAEEYINNPAPLRAKHAGKKTP